MKKKIAIFTTALVAVLSVAFAASHFVSEGVPNGNRSGVTGDLYSDQTGNALWIKTGGESSWGWVNVPTVTGTVALVTGTATVSTAIVTGSSRIFLTALGTTNAGNLGLGTIVSGTSFVITSTSGSDARTIQYLIQR